MLQYARTSQAEDVIIYAIVPWGGLSAESVGVSVDIISACVGLSFFSSRKASERLHCLANDLKLI